MIPRIIHYCWFGKNEKSALIVKCIESWKRFCPDYEIIEWNESNVELAHACRYVKEAYEAKKWAFVSDYVRHEVLNKFGGIYLDTDVELIKPIDKFLYGNFLALENADRINTGLIMGCEKNNSYCQWMLESYHNDRFYIGENELNTVTVCERTTRYFERCGFEKRDKKQSVAGFDIYPSEYFCPKDPISFEMNLTENTVSIHHYGASWCTPFQKEYFEKRSKYIKKYPYNLASVLAYFATAKSHHGLFKAFFMTVAKVFKRKASSSDD